MNISMQLIFLLFLLTGITVLQGQNSLAGESGREMLIFCPGGGVSLEGVSGLLLMKCLDLPINHAGFLGG